MKRVRILSYLVLTLGVLYLAVSSLSLYHYRKTLATFAYYGVSDEVQLSIPEFAQIRAQLMSGFITFLIAGVIVLLVGVGLFLAKAWALNIWLVLISLLVVLHIVRLASDYWISKFILLERVVEVVLVGGLAALSWFWVQRESHKRDMPSTHAAT